ERHLHLRWDESGTQNPGAVYRASGRNGRAADPLPDDTGPRYDPRGIAGAPSKSVLSDQHGLADDLAVDDRLNRIGRPIELEAVRDARLELPLARQLDKRFHVGAADLRLLLGDAAEPDADDLEPLDQEVIGARCRRPAAKKAEHEDAPAPGKTAQRLVEHIGADRVVDDIDAAIARQLLDPVAQPLAVVDRIIGALFEAGGALLVGAGGGDNGRAEQFGDLDRRDADAAGGAVDHDPIARLHAAALQQRVIGGVISAAEHGGCFETHAGGDRVAIVGSGIAELCEGADPVAAHDLVA